MAPIPDTNYFLDDRRVSKGFNFYGKSYDKHWIEIVECISYPHLEGWYLWDSGIEGYETESKYYIVHADVNKNYT